MDQMIFNHIIIWLVRQTWYKMKQIKIQNKQNLAILEFMSKYFRYVEPMWKKQNSSKYAIDNFGNKLFHFIGAVKIRSNRR